MGSLGYKEAFEKLGYSLSNVRQSWSAIKDGDQICMSVWSAETEFADGVAGFPKKSLGVDFKELEDTRFGAKERRRHLEEAWRKHGAHAIDVVVNTKPVEDGAGDCEIFPREGDSKGIRWRLKEFDPSSGSFYLVKERV